MLILEGAKPLTIIELARHKPMTGLNFDEILMSYQRMLIGQSAYFDCDGDYIFTFNKYIFNTD